MFFSKKLSSLGSYRSQVLILPALALASTLVTGCSRSTPAELPAIVKSVKIETVSEDKASVSPDQPTSSEVRVTAVVDKTVLLAEEFLYGADLQYSSQYDEGFDLYNQSMAIGHVPARFRIAGDELQLVADNKILYPSEVNHPEELIARFKILSQSGNLLVISGANTSVYLSEIFQATRYASPRGLTSPAGSTPRDHWIRSFEFEAKGNYLLQQSSIVLSDGTVAEFMESIFPRSSLNPGKDFKKFEMDAENALGGEGGIFDRIRLLGGQTVFSGETKLTYGQHFDISKTASNPEGTIDWYVTQNAPEGVIQPLKEAVEGWNRYFKNYKGLDRNVVRFMGRLPEGIHLGDPRFNVINWDSRLVAGAAYESQASDPQTGKQSHSLIYMPAAWLQIGFDYWKGGQFTDPVYTSPNSQSGLTKLISEIDQESVSARALEKHPVARAARLSCLKNLRSLSETQISGRLNQQEIAEFGIRLLKGTLFHEVGHALGLAHNFKGSLSFDRTKADSIFSNSIMDYNDYEIERQAFPELKSAEGPQLEYDRQALSLIYNDGKDVGYFTPTVPFCNDAEADNESGGVDPLCIRYDIEKDPTLAIQTAFDRIELAKKAGDITLSEAIGNVVKVVLTEDAIEEATSGRDLMQLASRVASGMNGAMRFYLLSGKASLGRVVKTQVKSLLMFAPDVLPEGYDEKAMRERAFVGVQKTLNMKKLPATVVEALKLNESIAVQALEQTPFVQDMPDSERAILMIKIQKAIHDSAMSIESDTRSGLPKLRASILGGLARHARVPYFFGSFDDQPAMDFETALVGILGDSVTKSELSANERFNAALALMTFEGRSSSKDAISAIRSSLAKSVTEAKNNSQRELMEALIGAMSPSSVEISR